MSQKPYANPLLLKEDDVSELQRISLEASGEDSYNEDYVRNLAFNHPSCLPISEIDNAYRDAVPVCKELNTPAGPMDALYVTPEGRLVILEAKLWRNPEARRKVVAQILDYAKELSRWSYDDLQRGVSASTGRKGNSLLEIIREGHPDVDEAEFVDSVSRSLRQGRFLLLILGDGIREGAAAIAEFMQRVGTLEFTFGLVELALYGSKESGIIVQPRILARTEIIQRQVIVVRDGQVQLEEDLSAQDEDEEISDSAKWYYEFWAELVDGLQFDDPEQPMAKAGKKGNLFFEMPPGMSEAWVSAYFIQSKGNVGVYLTFAAGGMADRLWGALIEERAEIEKEIGVPIEWRKRQKGKYGISHTVKYSDPRDPKHREEIQSMLSDVLNRFVNTFRHRLRRLTE